MGVYKLESYYSKNCDVKRVNIKTLLEEHRKENPDVEEATIVVDGTNFLRCLYKDLDWVAGGQLKQFHERVSKLLEQFKELNVKLVFFFDGPTVEQKRGRWIERRRQSMLDCRNVFSALQNHRYVHNNNFVLPPAIGNVARIFLQLEFGCEVHLSVRENDEEMALFAKKNNCFGILAQDTDFLIYDGAKYYFSMRELNWKTLETVLYEREKLAEKLGIKVELLPLFSSISGNDTVSCDLLREFHGRTCKKDRYIPQIGIASYIKSLEIDGEITEEIYKKIAADILYRRPRVRESREKRNDDRKSGGKHKEDGGEKKEDNGEGKKEGDGEKSEETVETKKEEEAEGEKMESEEVKEESEKEDGQGKAKEEKDGEKEKMEVDGEKEKGGEGDEKEKVAENGDKKAAEESVENSEEYLKRLEDIKNLLKVSVESYNIDLIPEADDVVIDDLVAGLGECDQWKQILTCALERHRSSKATTHIWSVLTGGAYELSCCLEDFYKRDLPVGAELTTNLRRRIYGILLMEKPLPADQTCHKVMEWCVDRSFRNNPKPKYLEAWTPKVYDHPGLLALWNSSADDEQIQNKRWNLFVRSISTNIDINEVKKLEPFLVAPTLALKYMVENLGYYQEFEMRVLVALALRVHSSTAEQLATQKDERPSPMLERPVRLASLYMRLQGCILFLITALNGPIPLTEVLPWNNFDGKLFQFLYSRSISSCSDTFLCNKDEKHLEQYNAVLKLVLPIKQKVNCF